jgi:hypothetical protein
VGYRRDHPIGTAEPAWVGAAEADASASCDPYLVRATALHVAGRMRDEDMVCGRTDLGLTKPAHRARGRRHRQRAESYARLRPLPRHGRARERQLILAGSGLTRAIAADNRREVDASTGSGSPSTAYQGRSVLLLVTALQVEANVAPWSSERAAVLYGEA